MAAAGAAGELAWGRGPNCTGGQCCTYIGFAVGMQLGKEYEGQEGHHAWSGVLSRTCKVILPPLALTSGLLTLLGCPSDWLGLVNG